MDCIVHGAAELDMTESLALVIQMEKDLPEMQETWVGKIPWRKGWQPTPVFLPGESPWTE